MYDNGIFLPGSSPIDAIPGAREGRRGPDVLVLVAM